LRYEPLSNLTWYESLLVARVHPVMSVITMTATGLLAYAGHVCNYYVKVMEWFQELPAVLRDKKWFLIKRRKSIRASAADTKQKKPTTANKRRLMAGMQEAILRMPDVYSGCRINLAEVEKFPEDGEREMSDQGEHVDMVGELALEKEVFCAWLRTGWEKLRSWQCASALLVYARDNQEENMRSTVEPDLVWDMCCNELPRFEIGGLSTGTIAQLIVYWLEGSGIEGEHPRLPEAVRQQLYKGMKEDLLDRGKKAVNSEEELAMQVRWIKQSIHRELDLTREAMATKNEDLPVYLDVEGGIMQGEAPSIVADAEEEAQKVISALQAKRAGKASADLEERANDEQDFDDAEWDDADWELARYCSGNTKNTPF